MLIPPIRCAAESAQWRREWRKEGDYVAARGARARGGGARGELDQCAAANARRSSSTRWRSKATRRRACSISISAVRRAASDKHAAARREVEVAHSALHEGNVLATAARGRVVGNLENLVTVMSGRVVGKESGT